MARDPQYRVEDFAEKFGVHIKTILRAVTKNPNASDWDPAPLKVSVVAKAFKMDADLLAKVMRGKEHLVRAEKAAELLSISVRRFHQRRQESKQPKPVAKAGRTVRYRHLDIVELQLADL